MQADSNPATLAMPVAMGPVSNGFEKSGYESREAKMASDPLQTVLDCSSEEHGVEALVACRYKAQQVSKGQRQSK